MRRAAPANWSNLPNRTVAFLHGLGHFQTPMRLTSCPLCPWKRTSSCTEAMSALCQ